MPYLPEPDEGPEAGRRFMAGLVLALIASLALFWLPLALLLWCCVF